MKYRVVNSIMVIVLMGLLSVHHFVTPVAWWVYLLVALAYSLVLFYGCVTLSSGFFRKVLCSADTNEKVVALTFDDGPHAHTTEILDTLKKYNVPAAFFCIGKNINGNESLLLRIRDEGHLIGDHSDSHHFWFDMFSADKMLVDMVRMEAKVHWVTGLMPILFRPPYGVMNPNLSRAIEKGGYTTIGWSVRSMDTTAKDKQKLLLRIAGKIRPGGIILLHDTMEVTAQVLSDLIADIHCKGYKIVRVDKMLNIEAYA